MEITAVFVMLLAIIFVLFAVCTSYFFIYKHHINKVLAEPQKKHRKLMPPYQVLLVLVLAAAVVGVSWLITILPRFDRIATVGEIEEDVRSFQHIRSDWEIEVAMNDRLAAVIAYDEKREEHTFSIYENDGNGKPNYVFRYGGKSTSIERGVRVFQLKGATAFLSMNALHIAAIECHDGARYEIDPNMPFALVIPNGGFAVYDSNGKALDITQDTWYELTKPE